MNGVDLLVIQPTPFCNINCSYCYLPDRTNSKKITADIIEHIADALIKDRLVGPRLSIVWHAGEPLVLPPGFYLPFFQLLESKFRPQGIIIQHTIQTNGTLITQDWCNLINQYGIKTGISIDGPREVHDTHRKTRSGKGTFDAIMNGLRLLQANNIPYHAIAVVTEKTLEDPDAFFDFFSENGFYQLGMNIEEIEGEHRQSSVFSEAVYEKVIAFYSRLFELYMTGDKHFRVREFDACLQAITRDPQLLDITRVTTQSHQNSPLAILSVDYQGNFSTFSPELIGQVAPEYNNFILGNILTTGFADVKQKSLLQKLSSEINQGIKKCKKECDFFHVCGGGAPANKYFENGTFNSSETKYCRYNIKVPTELVLSYMEKRLSI